MKNYLFLLLAGLCFACQSPQAEGEAKMSFPKDSISADGKSSFHGLRIDESNAIPAAELLAYVKENGPSQVKVVGPISAACKAKGCWMTLPIGTEKEMRVKFKDYGFFVPLDAAGKTAIAEGLVFVDTISVEENRHYAMDGGMSKEEAEQAITEPEIALSFEATGVIVRED